MWKPETIQRKYNEKLSQLLIEFESKMCDSLQTNYQGIKHKIKEMVAEEGPKSGIATAYVMHHRTMEFTDSIDAKHPIFKQQRS